WLRPWGRSGGGAPTNRMFRPVRADESVDMRSAHRGTFSFRDATHALISTATLIPSALPIVASADWLRFTIGGLPIPEPSSRSTVEYVSPSTVPTSQNSATRSASSLVSRLWRSYWPPVLNLRPPVTSVSSG